MNTNSDLTMENNNSKIFKQGLKIMNFHPIHIYLNSFTIKKYEEMKSKIDLKDVTKESIVKYINTLNYGISDLFLDIIKIMKNSKTYTVQDIAIHFRKQPKLIM